METTLTPEFQRELIRLGAVEPEPLNGTEVTALVEFAEYMVSMSGEDQNGVTAIALFDVWKESFNEQP